MLRKFNLTFGVVTWRWREHSQSSSPTRLQRMSLGRLFPVLKKQGCVLSRLAWSSLTVDKAKGFYAEHDGKGFFEDLVNYMSSGPVIVQVMEGEGAIALNRQLMGATNPADADAGTIRADFAESIEANAVHGSDSPESAAREISYFFEPDQLCNR